jgi:hypothetical protein
MNWQSSCLIFKKNISRPIELGGRALSLMPHMPRDGPDRAPSGGSGALVRLWRKESAHLVRGDGPLLRSLREETESGGALALCSTRDRLGGNGSGEHA